MRNNIFKGTLAFSAGQISAKLISFILIPVYTRFLTTEEYGILGYLLVISSILSAILGLGISEYQTRELAEIENDEDKRKKFLFSINFLITGITILFVFFLQITGNHLVEFFNLKIPFFPYFTIIIWTIPVQILNQINISYYLGVKEYSKCAKRQFILFSLINFSSIILVCIFRLGVIGKISGIFLGNLLYFLFFFKFYISNLKIPALKIFNRYTISALVFGLPMVVHQIAMMIHTSIDRIILERFVSLSQLGLYSFAYQIGMLLQTITLSVNRSIQPNFYEIMKNNDEISRKKHILSIFKIWYVMIGSICALSIIWIKEMIFIFIPIQYLDSYKIASIIFFSYFIGIFYFYFSLPIFYYKKTKIIPLITFIAMSINVVLNFIFIPVYGVIGAAYATFFSYFIQTILAYYYGKKLFDPQYPVKNILFLILGVSSIFIIFNINENTILFFSIKAIYSYIFGLMLFKSFNRFRNL